MSKKVMADCEGCHSKEDRCVVKTKAGAFIVQPSINGRRVCAPTSKKGDWITPTVDECLGGVVTPNHLLETLERNIITALKTTKGIVHMELSYAHMDARLSPLPL
ncbi:MAG: hypothetical protein NUV64_02725 [Parcubacteria group bacterium]|nr:hypothetical protein [Parcubacteria group bacterium]MCR4342929.1 hypothetical protein [Patescibacteria group bacterium]